MKKKYKTVMYTLRQDIFEVTVDKTKYTFFSNNWNEFLDKYGSNPNQKNGEKRISGTDSVEEEAFEKFVKLTDRQSI